MSAWKLLKCQQGTRERCETTLSFKCQNQLQGKLFKVWLLGFNITPCHVLEYSAVDNLVSIAGIKTEPLVDIFPQLTLIALFLHTPLCDLFN